MTAVPGNVAGQGEPTESGFLAEVPGITAGQPEEALSASRREPRLRAAIASAVTTLSSLAIFFPAAVRDPDFHHDGIVLAAAIGAAEGRAVHAEVFTMYGPVTTWLQALAIWILGPELTSIRIQGALGLSLIAGLIVFLTVRLTGRLLLASLAAALWVLACPDWTQSGLPPLLAWPSVYFAMLALFSLAMLVEALVASGPRVRSALAVGSGSLLALACFTRLQLGAAQVVATATVFALGLIFLRRDHRTRPINEVAARWAVGGLLAGSALVVILWVGGAWDDFWQQSVVGPAGTFGSLIDPVFLTLLAVMPMLSFGLLLGAAKLMPVSARDVGIASPRIPSALLTGVLAIFCLYAVARWRVGDWWLLLAPAAAAALALGSLRGIRRDSCADPVPGTQKALIGIAGVASWLQLIPLGDALHLWWAAPIPLVAAAVFLNDVMRPRERLLLAGALAASILVFAAQYISKASVPRVPLEGGTLAGMRVEAQDRAHYDLLAAFVNLSDLRSSHIHSADGIFAVWDGTYTPASGSYVDWAFGPRDDAGLRARVLACGRRERDLAEWTARNGGELVRSTGVLRLGSNRIDCGWIGGGPFRFVHQDAWWLGGYWAGPNADEAGP